MTPVAIIDKARDFGRCASFWKGAVRLGLLRAIRLSPVTVYLEEWQVFAEGLTPDTIRQVNALLTRTRKKAKKPASPDGKRRGVKPGSGLISKMKGVSQTDHAGVGGTNSGTFSGVPS